MKREKGKRRPGLRRPGAHASPPPADALGSARLARPGTPEPHLPRLPRRPHPGIRSGKDCSLWDTDSGSPGWGPGGAQTCERPPPQPRGAPATIPCGQSRQAGAEWRQARVWPPREDLLAPVGIASSPASPCTGLINTLPGAGIGVRGGGQRQTAEAVERVLARALNSWCGFDGLFLHVSIFHL